VFQSVLPVLLFSPHSTKVVLRGGTDFQKSPPVDYTNHILLPFLKKHFGVESTLEIRKRGFSSHGGGELFLTIDPLEDQLKCINIRERGDITGFTGIIWTSRQEYANVAHLHDSADSRLQKHWKRLSKKN
jgi:RNA 3'-terminal phosphate cyclase (ATP)